MVEKGVRTSSRSPCRPAAPLLCTLLAAVVSSSCATAAASRDYAIGADLSFLKLAEAQGVRFKDDGRVRPGLEIFKKHGYNWIRLRLFHTPASHQPSRIRERGTFRVSIR